MKDAWVKRLAGVSLHDIKITALQNNKRYRVSKGKILFTHVGVSGPTILNMSKDIGELLKYGEVTLLLDLLPAVDHSELDAQFQKLFHEHGKKLFKNVVAEGLPAVMAPAAAELSGIRDDIQCSSITREERVRLVALVKGMPMRVRGLLGADKAIVSSGGVALEEIDFKTMRSRLYPNLYIIGDLLNIDRPSGGYSLQLCWTTGFVAGNAAGQLIGRA
jgi:hypothetical protein